jgi:hypothetical protein
MLATKVLQRLENDGEGYDAPHHRETLEFAILLPILQSPKGPKSEPIKNVSRHFQAIS